MRKVEVEKRKCILDDFFKVNEAHLRYERFDGQMSPLVRRLNFERGDSVAAVVFNLKTDRLLFVNQFKYPAYEKGPGWITEVVAGMINQDESPEAAARREIREELGYNILQIEHIATFYVSPGGSSERIILFYTEVDDGDKTDDGGGVSSEDEDIITVNLSLEDALSQIQTGQIADAKTILGILWFQNRMINRTSAPTGPS